MRAGDVVKHGPTGETWIVAVVDDGHVYWHGWPEGYGKASECTLVKPCSDEEHVKALEDWALKERRNEYGFLDRRCAIASAQLDAMGVRTNAAKTAQAQS